MQKNSDLTHCDDEGLMQRIKKYDDQHAFEILLNRHSKQWFHFTMRMIHNEAIAEELMQELCLKIWNNRHKWEAKAKVNTWVYKMIYHACLDHLKSIKNKPCLPLDEQHLSALSDSSLELNATIEKIKESLNTLQIDHKALFVLHYYHSFSQVELSDMFGLSKSAIESLFFRIRKKLKETLS